MCHFLPPKKIARFQKNKNKMNVVRIDVDDNHRVWRQYSLQFVGLTTTKSQLSAAVSLLDDAAPNVLWTVLHVCAKNSTTTATTTAATTTAAVKRSQVVPLLLSNQCTTCSLWLFANDENVASDTIKALLNLCKCSNKNNNNNNSQRAEPSDSGTLAQFCLTDKKASVASVDDNGDVRRRRVGELFARALYRVVARRLVQQHQYRFDAKRRCFVLPWLDGIATPHHTPACFEQAPPRKRVVSRVQLIAAHGVLLAVCGVASLAASDTVLLPNHVYGDAETWRAAGLVEPHDTNANAVARFAASTPTTHDSATPRIVYAHLDPPPRSVFTTPNPSVINRFVTSIIEKKNENPKS